MLTTFLALLPILWLIVALAILKMPAWKACSIAAIGSFIIAITHFEKAAGIMFSGALEGVALAVWPILLVITAAIFTYNLVVHTKAMDTIKMMLSSVTSDMRILALLLAWGFGAFMEGMAGFGTAVAIPAAMMVAVGFDPLKSILACLVANSVPTTFGSIAIPTTTLASLTNLDPIHLGTFISSQLFILNVIAPFFVVGIIGGGFKALKGVFTITLLSGLALAVPELLINVAAGPELSVMASSVIIMGVIILGAKFLPTNDPQYQFEATTHKVTGKEGFIAALPFILIVILLILTSKLVPAINTPLASIKTAVPIYQGEGAKPYTFVWVATPGIMIFIAAFIGGAVQKSGFGEMLGVLGKTISNLKFTYLTIITVVVTAKLMTYSGMTADIASALVSATGSLYPAFAPLVGALGAFLTGSGTNANVLFGPLQLAAAHDLNPNYADLPLWLAAINSGAAGIGKMFSPQSIAIAIGAVAPALDAYIESNKVDSAKANQLRESIKANVIMVSVLKYFLIFIIANGVISYFGHNFIEHIQLLLFK
ncbi:L-lactate permease [Veillonella sp. R32]|uniref:L-lactate permease n=1 Tax=Veillonella sp. R32 TaxID=2021312 RepID=UPI001389EDE4|nr:L-lactate permease [Veillonella sp. R32]KAF1682497.1 lactate permease [Veillonella sp. R32]